MMCLSMRRAHLQARLPPDASAGILANEHGQLLEGFITNLFIISGGPFTGAPAGLDRPFKSMRAAHMHAMMMMGCPQMLPRSDAQ